MQGPRDGVTSSEFSCLQTHVSRSAESPRQINEVRIGKFSARSAGTRRIVGVPRGQLQAIAIESGVVRKCLSMKYRDATVGHCKNLPVLTGIASSKLSSQVCSKVNDARAVCSPLRRFSHPHYPPARVPLPPSPDDWCLFLLFVPSEVRGPRVIEKSRRSSSLPMLPWATIRQSLGKRRQRAHRRRFARPPRSLNRAGLKSRGRRERSKRYIMPCFPQRK